MPLTLSDFLGLALHRHYGRVWSAGGMPEEPRVSCLWLWMLRGRVEEAAE